MSDRRVEWIRAQLDATEAAARAASPGPWAWGERCIGGKWFHALTAGQGDVISGADVIIPSAISDVYPTMMDARHIALHDPAAVLADVASKREMLDDLLAEPHYAWDGRSEYGCPKFISADEWADLYDSPQVCDCGRDERVARRIRLLAEGFRGRPGYAEAMRDE